MTDVRLKVVMRPLFGMNRMLKEKFYNFPFVIHIVDASSHLVIFVVLRTRTREQWSKPQNACAGKAMQLCSRYFDFYRQLLFISWQQYFLVLFYFSFYYFIIFCDNNIFINLFRSPLPSWKLSSGPTQPLRMQWLLGFQTLRGVKYQWRMSSAKMTTNSRKSK